MKNLCRSKGGSCNCLQKSTWGEGGSKSPKTGLRSLWMAPMWVWYYLDKISQTKLSQCKFHYRKGKVAVGYKEFPLLLITVTITCYE